MNNKQKNRLSKIAAHVRVAVATWVEYNDDICNDDLNGACAIASFALWKVLTTLGYKCNFIVRHVEDFGGHCWIEIDDMALDITATQFGGPEVALYPVNDVPDWFPGELLFSVSDCEEEPKVEEYIGIDGINYTSNWGDQNALLYSNNVDMLVKYFKKKERITQNASNS